MTHLAIQNSLCNNPFHSQIYLASSQKQAQCWWSSLQPHISFTFHDRLILESSKDRQVCVLTIFFLGLERSMNLTGKWKKKICILHLMPMSVSLYPKCIPGAVMKVQIWKKNMFPVIIPQYRLSTAQLRVYSTGVFVNSSLQIWGQERSYW